jgi:hypothetical protein
MSSKRRVFLMEVLKWAPKGFVPWFFSNDNHPGMVRLRENKKYGHEVAMKLIEEKRQELKDGNSRKDLLSLLGLFCVFSVEFDVC